MSRCDGPSADLVVWGRRMPGALSKAWGATDDLHGQHLASGEQCCQTVTDWRAHRDRQWRTEGAAVQLCKNAVQCSAVTSERLEASRLLRTSRVDAETSASWLVADTPWSMTDGVHSSGIDGEVRFILHRSRWRLRGFERHERGDISPRAPAAANRHRLIALIPPPSRGKLAWLAWAKART